MEKYGLVGYPLGHSFSRDFFNEKFANEKIDAEFVNFEIPSIDSFPDILAENTNLRGLNVTIPYKEKIISYMDELNEDARRIGAVNVVRITNHKGKLYLKGFNSDIIGFTRSIEPLLTPTQRKALILGSGGASKAVYHGLQKLGLESTFVSRHPQKDMLSYDQLYPEIIAEYKVIVNCTPVGMFPHTNECPDLPYEFIGSDHLLYDLIYNPEETLFLKKGREQGTIIKNGLEMLLLQAYAGWDYWHSED
ncbi:MAG: shikimate dehydrogenase [Paraprevotella sp.]|nr:shikimate dehydrogenase [Paraprevotella sp.]